MLAKLQNKRQQGFTIIEVLIVLAIAGLIMLIVFLAVPSLQRNARNTQRTNDAALIANAISDCLANKNGQIASCDTTAELTALGLDVTKLTQISPVANIVVGAADPTLPPAGSVNHANAGFTAKCNVTADDVDTNGTNREAAVLYRIEVQGNNNGVGRCIPV